MAKKAKKSAKLHKSKKLEAQKALRTNHSDFSIVKTVDIPSPKLYTL